MSKDTIDEKIIQAIERIARAQRILLWDRAKLYGLTPLQSQILFYISENNPEKCTIMNLSLELGVSQPTISDSVKTLMKKGLVEQEVWEKNRHFKLLKLTDKGKEILKALRIWDDYLRRPLKEFSEEEKKLAFNFLLDYVAKLRKDKTLLMAKTCVFCKFLEEKAGTYYCKLFNMNMKKEDLRIDCPDFEEASAGII